MKTFVLSAFAASTLLSLILCGCGGTHATSGHGETHSHGGAGADQAAIQSAMAKLSEADRKAAETQKLCLVSDAPLGSMGAPVKVDVNGESVFICCEHCREALEQNPAKFLAKLKKHPG